MRATVMYGAGDVRIENVTDARIIEPTDALVTVTRACICGSDLWPYKEMEQSETGRVMGHEAIGVIESVGSEVVSSSGRRKSATSNTEAENEGYHLKKLSLLSGGVLTFCILTSMGEWYYQRQTTTTIC
jgi:threonine dehydrogenase-like Zn-dependent dehydrogenase